MTYWSSLKFSIDNDDFVIDSMQAEDGCALLVYSVRGEQARGGSTGLWEVDYGRAKQRTKHSALLIISK